MSKKLRAAIYARVSDDDGKTESIATQVRQCREYAKAKGFRVVSVFDKDSGISGGIKPSQRPDGARLYAARKRGEFDVVIITEPTRLFRSDELAAELRKWEATGVKVLFVGNEVDMSNDNWEMSAGMHGMMGQQFRRMIAKKTHAALLSRFLRRSWVAGRPYGYDNGVDPKDPTRKILIINKEQAKIVKRIFAMWNDLDSCSTIAQALNKDGISSPGAKWKRAEKHEEWINTAVRAILQNPIYTGHVRWNVSQWKLNTETGVRERKERAEKPLSYHDEDYEIIDDAVFAAAKKRFSAVSDNDPRLKQGGKTIYRLSGMLQCGVCRRNYVMDNRTHYSCAGAKDGACTNRLRIRRELAESIILGDLTAMLKEPAMVQDMAREIDKEHARRTKGSTSSERTELEAKIKRLRQRIKTGDRDLSNDQLQAAVDQAVLALAALNAAPTTRKGVSKTASDLEKNALLYSKKLATSSPEARKILTQLTGGVIVLEPVQATAKVPAHLEARFLVQRMALLEAGVGPSGSGGVQRIYLPCRKGLAR